MKALYLIAILSVLYFVKINVLFSNNLGDSTLLFEAPTASITSLSNEQETVLPVSPNKILNPIEQILVASGQYIDNGDGTVSLKSSPYIKLNHNGESFEIIEQNLNPEPEPEPELEPEPEPEPEPDLSLLDLIGKQIELYFGTHSLSNPIQVFFKDENFINIGFADNLLFEDVNYRAFSDSSFAIGGSGRGDNPFVLEFDSQSAGIFNSYNNISSFEEISDSNPVGYGIFSVKTSDIITQTSDWEYVESFDEPIDYNRWTIESRLNDSVTIADGNALFNFSSTDTPELDDGTFMYYNRQLPGTESWSLEIMDLNIFNNVADGGLFVADSNFNYFFIMNLTANNELEIIIEDELNGEGIEIKASRQLDNLHDLDLRLVYDSSSDELIFHYSDAGILTEAARFDFTAGSLELSDNTFIFASNISQVSSRSSGNLGDNFAFFIGCEAIRETNINEISIGSVCIKKLSNVHSFSFGKRDFFDTSDGHEITTISEDFRRELDNNNDDLRAPYVLNLDSLETNTGRVMSFEFNHIMDNITNAYLNIFARPIDEDGTGNESNDVMFIGNIDSTGIRNEYNVGLGTETGSNAYFDFDWNAINPNLPSSLSNGYEINIDLSNFDTVGYYDGQDDKNGVNILQSLNEFKALDFGIADDSTFDFVELVLYTEDNSSGSTTNDSDGDGVADTDDPFPNDPIELEKLGPNDFQPKDYVGWIEVSIATMNGGFVMPGIWHPTQENYAEWFAFDNSWKYEGEYSWDHQTQSNGYNTWKHYKTSNPNIYTCIFEGNSSGYGFTYDGRIDLDNDGNQDGIQIRSGLKFPAEGSQFDFNEILESLPENLMLFSLPSSVNENDFDGDGRTDITDIDDDNDGIADSYDSSPLVYDVSNKVPTSFTGYIEIFFSDYWTAPSYGIWHPISESNAISIWNDGSTESRWEGNYSKISSLTTTDEQYGGIFRINLKDKTNDLLYKFNYVWYSDDDTSYDSGYGFFYDERIDLDSDGLADGEQIQSGIPFPSEGSSLDLANIQTLIESNFIPLNVLDFASDEKYSHNDIKDLRPGSVTIEVVDGEASINMDIESSTDLNNWELDSTISFPMPIDNGETTKFFRFKMSE